jgi:hypothetical protein
VENVNKRKRSLTVGGFALVECVQTLRADDLLVDGSNGNELCAASSLILVLLSSRNYLSRMS